MFQRANRHRLVVYLLLALTTACSPDTAPPEPSTVQQTEQSANIAADRSLQGHVSAAHAKYGLVALGAVIASSDGVIDVAVAGHRDSKLADPALPTDMWHLGSNTKALTALLYTQLVERGLAEWDSPMPNLFPNIASEMDPAWTEITIEHLFAHRTGLAQKGGFWLNARRRDDRPLADQRYDAAREALIAPPRKDPATFDYNNLNYIIAGAAIERILQTQPELPNSWEGAMQALLFDRLNSAEDQNGFGFGPPLQGLEGHRSLFGGPANPVGRGKAADNPQVLGPAGTLHATLSAHAALAKEFLNDDSALISLAARDKLFTPYPDSESTYAMGWGLRSDKEFGLIYLHSGSNTMWISQIVIVPDLDRVVIVNSNQFDDAAQAAVSEVVRAVLNDAKDSMEQKGN